MSGDMFGDTPVGMQDVMQPVMEPAVVRDPPRPNGGVTINQNGKYAEDRVRIILEHNDDIPPTGLFLAVNGVGYMLKSNMEADIPLSVKEVLDHAVMSTPVKDDDTQQVVGFRDRLRFPYRFLKYIPADPALKAKAA